MSDSKRLIRRTMRARRRALGPGQQRRAGEAVANHLGRQLFFARARHVAFYLPNDGEIDPLPLLRRACAAGKTPYLPFLDTLRGKRMTFLPWRPGDPLKVNCYGIPEPRNRRARRRPPWFLDVVCLPLVAFDKGGNRLGMGGGYYDRTFAGRDTRSRHKPLLVGLAHDFQQVETLPAEPWDVPLHAIATESGVFFP